MINFLYRRVCLYIFIVLTISSLYAQNTFESYDDEKKVPKTFQEMWAGYDPRKEPLEVEVLKAWEEEGVVVEVLRYTVGTFKGQKSKMIAVYGYPKGKTNLPAIVQVHGGGQAGQQGAVMAHAKRGYAVISISWAGRLGAKEYQVGRNEVALFWDNKTDDPKYKLTTDWGALDGYHAPSRYKQTNFYKVSPSPYTIDQVPSAHNCAWFLATMGARRAITFLEQQKVVNPDKIGIYGHSMGGKITVLTSAADKRLKASVPSCGGISDRYHKEDDVIFMQSLSDGVNLEHISCPILFLSPSNDFHGRIDDLTLAVKEIKSKEYRMSCSPHLSHSDPVENLIAGSLWLDQHLKGTFKLPETPQQKLTLNTKSGVPSLEVIPDASRKILYVDVFYTQNGRFAGEKDNRNNTKARHWHYAKPTKSGNTWKASLPIHTLEKPLWVYANVVYALDKKETGADYGSKFFSSDKVNLSSLVQLISPEELQKAKVKATVPAQLMIENFDDGWEKEWYSKTTTWSYNTHKLYAPRYQAPSKQAKLAIKLAAKQALSLNLGIANEESKYNAKLSLQANEEKEFILSLEDFTSKKGTLQDWGNISVFDMKLASNSKAKPTMAYIKWVE